MGALRLEEIINEHRSRLGETDMLIWKYIVQHRASAGHISIHELARACAVSSTTVVRFAQKLGLDGFGELKAMLKLEERTPQMASRDVEKELTAFYGETARRLTVRNYDEASRLMHEAHRVFAYASGFVQANVVQELKRIFSYAGILIYELSGKDEFRQLKSMLTKDDLFIFVSLSGETPRVTAIAEECRLLDVPFISITRLHDNTLASLSTQNLYVTPAEFHLPTLVRDEVPFQSMMPYFLLIEIWYVKYRMYLERCTEGTP